MDKEAHEELVDKLRDPEALAAYAAECNAYRPSLPARILGNTLVTVGTLVYGAKPSYEKFKAIEVIARIPYQSWEAVAYTLLTRFYSDEYRAMKYAKVLPFARHAQDNETMHVVMISQIVRAHGKEGIFRHTLLPLVFSFIYYWSVWLVSLFSRKIAFEVNYLFENHAYHQYRDFLKQCGEHLKTLPLDSDYLKFYGRDAATEYELFESIMIDEVIHRNYSIAMVKELEHGGAM